MKERLSYIDVMKGILMLTVIFGHIVYTVYNASQVNITEPGTIFMDAQFIASQWIAPFYMAAFFCVTGYCSKFELNKKRIWKDIKTLFIPTLTIPPICKIITKYGTGHIADWSIFHFSLNIGAWFLVALLFSKIIVSVVNHYYNDKKYQILLLCIISIIGCILMNEYIDYNYLSIFNAMAFTPFLFLGNWIKKTEDRITTTHIIISVIIYIAIAEYYIQNYYICPSLCAGIWFTSKEWPAYMAMATTGTLVVYKISKLIGKNKILEHIGRNSLVIYMTHCTFLEVFGYVTSSILAEHYKEPIFAIFYLLLCFALSTIWALIWAWIFDLKNLRWMIGKF